MEVKIHFMLMSIAREEFLFEIVNSGTLYCEYLIYSQIHGRNMVNGNDTLKH